MRFLRRLFLSDNVLTDIGRGTFGSIARIGTIDLARNQLKKVEYQMFTQMNYVEVSFKNHKYFNKPTNGSPKFQLLDLAENNIAKIEKNSFKDIYQAVINVSHNALELIETAAFENCVNITVLDLSHNLLTNFSRRSFDETTFATYFQLSYNNLTNLAQVTECLLHFKKNTFLYFSADSPSKYDGLESIKCLTQQHCRDTQELFPEAL